MEIPSILGPMIFIVLRYVFIRLNSAVAAPRQHHPAPRRRPETHPHPRCEAQDRRFLLLDLRLRSPQGGAGAGGIGRIHLHLSATPVNNRFTDLRNQLALAYEGDPDQLQSKLRSEKSIDEIFRRAQTAFNAWSALPSEERTAAAILNALDFDFFELLDSVTIARSRRHIQTYYDTKDIGNFPERLRPHSHHCKLTQREDVIGFNDIFARLTALTLAVYAPLTYVQPSRLGKYQDLYDPDAEGQTRNLNQSGREKGIQALMTVNLLKRLESSVHSFRLTLGSLEENHRRTLEKIAIYQKTGRETTFGDIAPAFADYEPDEDEPLPLPDSDTIGSKVQISLPALFEIQHSNRIRFAASYKRPSDADASKWVIEGSLLLDWQSAETPRLPLPVALDLSSLHDQLIRQHVTLCT